MYRPYFCTPPGSPASAWSQGYIGPAVTPPTQSCTFNVHYISTIYTISSMSSTFTISSITSTTTLVNCVQTSPLLPNPMYSYPRPPTLVANSPFIPPITTSNYTTISESQRVLAQENPSTFVYKQQVEILPGGFDVPIITVQNTPASITTQKRQTATLAAANNPYSSTPTVRFAQYFPPQSPGIPFFPIVNVPPYGVRNYPVYPNSSPQVPPVTCVPNTRFSGINPSVPNTTGVNAVAAVVSSAEPFSVAPGSQLPVASTAPKPPVVRRPRVATQNVEPM